MNLLQSNSILLILGFALAFARICHGGESSTCLTVYKEGGAPAVFQSPKCPRWSLPSYHQPQPDRSTAPPTSGRCQWAMLQGRRKYQEDRILCAHNLRIPLPGKIGLKEVRVDMVAVFDGHNGAEASEMASKLLLEYFALHTYFLLDATYSLAFKKSTGRMRDEGAKDVDFQLLSSVDELGRPDYKIESRFKFSLPDNFDDSFHFEILKEALLRAIHDIDTTFAKEASRNNLKSGSTAAVVLLADGQILVANLGDSKALLCSEKFLSPEEAKASLLNKYREQIRNGVVSNARNYRSIRSATSKGVKRFHFKDLTQDHHPDREEEKIRVEAAGGYILETSGVPRVNGELAVSRAIGDFQLKSYGVISVPEVTNWQPLTTSDSYLVVASDGVFEKLGSQEVCDILWEVPNCGAGKPGLSSHSYSLAECLVETAFVKGSMDNIAAVVVPLGPGIVSETLLKERCAEEEDINCSSTVVTKFVHEQSAEDLTSELANLEHRLPLITEFSRLLVEAKYANLGCYYLDENLNYFIDTWKAQHTVSKHYTNELRQALPEALDHHDEDGFKGQCPNPEGFSSFLGLLESIPFPDAGSSYVSTDEVMPDLRYLLKKRFGRGAYGEVWLAFHWNCHQETNGSDCIIKNENISSEARCSGPSMKHSCSSCHGQSAGSSDGDMFILKRIMVEKGPAVYLSGLREKYFGEMFSNASKSVQGISDAYGSSFSEDFESDFDKLSKISESFYGLGSKWLEDNMLLNRCFLVKDYVYC
ncbi:Probable protein phosphatase 2C 51 [Linum perenne]